MVHACVRVEDLEAPLDFCQKAFNLEESRRRDFPENKLTLAYLTLPGDDYELELIYDYGHEAYDLGNGYGHTVINTGDLRGLHEKHQAAGFTVAGLKGLPGVAPSHYFAVDPDSYRIEVICKR